MLNIGDKAPNFTLYDKNGQSVSLIVDLIGELI